MLVIREYTESVMEALAYLYAVLARDAAAEIAPALGAPHPAASQEPARSREPGAIPQPTGDRAIADQGATSMVAALPF